MGGPDAWGHLAGALGEGTQYLGTPWWLIVGWNEIPNGLVQCLHPGGRVEVFVYNWHGGGFGKMERDWLLVVLT